MSYPRSNIKNSDAGIGFEGSCRLVFDCHFYNAQRRTWRLTSHPVRAWSRAMRSRNLLMASQPLTCRMTSVPLSVCSGQAIVADDLGARFKAEPRAPRNSDCAILRDDVVAVELRLEIEKPPFHHRPGSAESSARVHR